MPRAISAANLTELQQKHTAPAFFCYLDFASGAVRLHSDLGTVNWGGNDWLGAGSLGSVSSLEEGESTSPYSITLTLSGIDNNILNEVNNNNYFLREAILYMGFFGADGQLVDDPFEVWSGFMNTADVELGGDNDRISMSCESELSLFAKSNGTLTTNETQQAEFPNDLFFEYLEQIPTAKPRWRGEVGAIAGTEIQANR